MFAYGSFDHFINDICWRENNSYEIPITIGLLVCDLRQQYCKENIFNYMNHFNQYSGDYINFYIPGYCTADKMNQMIGRRYDSLIDFYRIKGKNYYFSEDFFDEFIEELRVRYSIIYNGEPELILVEVSNGRIHWDKKLIFRLKTLQEKGKIETVYSFFDFIFEYAQKYVNIDDFSKAGRTVQLKKSFLEIIKEKIPKNLKTLYENDSVYRIK